MPAITSAPDTWTNAISSGQTFSLTRSKTWALSTFEMYEFHTPQEGTETHPGQTFDLDYSLVRNLTFPRACSAAPGRGHRVRGATDDCAFRPRHHTRPYPPTVTPSTPSASASQVTFPAPRLNSRNEVLRRIRGSVNLSGLFASVHRCGELLKEHGANRGSGLG